MSHSLVAGDITGTIIRCFYRVYDRLGFGFLESVYRRVLALELREDGIQVREEAGIDVIYDGARVGRFRADLLVAGAVIVEIKSTAVLVPADHRQLLNYLRSSEIDVGLLLHFGPKPVFHRVFYDLRPNTTREIPADARSPSDERISRRSRTDRDGPITDRD